MRALAERLSDGGARALASVPLERRVAAWNDARSALLDPTSAERRELFPVLVESSRLSPEGLSEALEIVLGGLGGRALEPLLARLPAPRDRALAGVVLASNVPGLAAQSILPALLLGRPLLVKSSSREPLFAAALVRALAGCEPALGDAFAAVAWPHEHRALTESAFARCERVVAYGGQATIDALAASFGGRLVAHGPRASVAFVAGAFDPVGLGRALARDVAVFDQRGCLSVQAVYVDGDAPLLAEGLAFGLACEHARLPPGPCEAEIAARVQQWRGEAELSGTLVAGLSVAQGTVILTEEVAFRPVPGLRTVIVHGSSSIESAVAALAPWRGRLQGAALGGTEAATIPAHLAPLALTRIAPAGQLQHADALWASGTGFDPFEALG